MLSAFMESVKTGVFMFVNYKRRAPHNLVGQYPIHIKHLCKRKKAILASA